MNQERRDRLLTKKKPPHITVQIINRKKGRNSRKILKRVNIIVVDNFCTEYVTLIAFFPRKAHTTYSFFVNQDKFSLPLIGYAGCIYLLETQGTMNEKGNGATKVFSSYAINKLIVYGEGSTKMFPSFGKGAIKKKRKTLCTALVPLDQLF